jgi:hypothetical protein
MISYGWISKFIGKIAMRHTCSAAHISSILVICAGEHIPPADASAHDRARDLLIRGIHTLGASWAKKDVIADRAASVSHEGVLEAAQFAHRYVSKRTIDAGELEAQVHSPENRNFAYVTLKLMPIIAEAKGRPLPELANEATRAWGDLHMGKRERTSAERDGEAYISGFALRELIVEHYSELTEYFTKDMHEPPVKKAQPMWEELRKTSAGTFSIVDKPTMDERASIVGLLREDQPATCTYLPPRFGTNGNPEIALALAIHACPRLVHNITTMTDLPKREVGHSLATLFNAMESEGYAAGYLEAYRTNGSLHIREDTGDVIGSLRQALVKLRRKEGLTVGLEIADPTYMRHIDKETRYYVNSKVIGNTWERQPEVVVLPAVPRRNSEQVQTYAPDSYAIKYYMDGRVMPQEQDGHYALKSIIWHVREDKARRFVTSCRNANGRWVMYGVRDIREMSEEDVVDMQLSQDKLCPTHYFYERVVEGTDEPTPV